MTKKEVVFLFYRFKLPKKGQNRFVLKDFYAIVFIA